MNTDLNYTLMTLFALAALAFMAFLIWKNNRDEREVVRDITKRDFVRREHKKDTI